MALDDLHLYSEQEILDRLRVPTCDNCYNCVGIGVGDVHHRLCLKSKPMHTENCSEWISGDNSEQIKRVLKEISQGLSEE